MPCVDLFRKIGIDLSMNEREYVAHAGNIRAIQVKNSDLPRYLSHGTANIGIVGTDILQESGSRFFSLGTFPFGKARICLAAEKDISVYSQDEFLRVATKYPHIAGKYFHGRGIPVEVIFLSGSVELAPQLGLAHCIVDLVETGRTLTAHNLTIVEELFPTEVQLVANPAFYKVCFREVDDLVERMKL